MADALKLYASDRDTDGKASVLDRWAPFSEQWGRRPIFIITYALFAIFNIPCAVAKNVETLLVCRFLAGFFGSSPLTNSGGVISDMFSASERALAVSLYAAAPFAGPVIGVSTPWIPSLISPRADIFPSTAHCRRFRHHEHVVALDLLDFDDRKRALAVSRCGRRRY